MAHVRTQLPYAPTAALLATVLAAVLLAGGLSLVWRHGGKMPHWLALGGAMVALRAAWVVLESEWLTELRTSCNF